MASKSAQDGPKGFRSGGSPGPVPPSLAPDHLRGGRTLVTEARWEETAPREARSSNVTAPPPPEFPIPFGRRTAPLPASSGCSLSPHFSPWRPQPPALGVVSLQKNSAYTLECRPLKGKCSRKQAMMQGRTSGRDRTARAQPKRRWVSAGPHLGGWERRRVC